MSTPILGWVRYLCTKDTNLNPISISSKLVELGIAEAAEPGFASSINDTSSNYRASSSSYPNPYDNLLFPDQWGLDNYGQAGGDTSYDIKAIDAWKLSTGEGVLVGVYDTGVQLDHPALAQNLAEGSFDVDSINLIGAVYNSHGTSVAGIIVASKSAPLVGVAYDAKFISISKREGIIEDQKIGGAFLEASSRGVDIINCSWGREGHLYSELEATCIKICLDTGRNGKGTIVVFSSGNDNINKISFPANADPRILTVGWMTPCGRRAAAGDCSLTEGGSNYGFGLDVVAPGNSISTTDLMGEAGYNPPSNPEAWDYGAVLPDYTNAFNGTSAAAPFVSGVAALILSANPELTGVEVARIINSTAQQLKTYTYTDYHWNNEVGYGLVDAYEAVRLAKSPKSDLYIQDFAQDRGMAYPYGTTVHWESPSIWVSSMMTNFPVYENPAYTPGKPHYVQVKISNRGIKKSPSNAKVKVHWAFAGISLTSGSFYGLENVSGNLPSGGLIGEVDIPSIEPGGSIVVSIEWMLPNPDDYIEFSNTPRHFCLLAEIQNPDEQGLGASSIFLEDYVTESNNVAMKNITIVDYEDPDYSHLPGGFVFAYNQELYPRNYSIIVEEVDPNPEKSLSKEAEISIQLDETLRTAWRRGGNKLSDFTEARSELRAKSHRSSIDSIILNPQERGVLGIRFNFLTRELTKKNEYKVRVILKDNIANRIVGGETYIIKKKSRALFNAEISEQRGEKASSTISLCANSIGEEAKYTWLNSMEEIIGEGESISINRDQLVGDVVILEVLADKDGYKDYTQSQITAGKFNEIERVYPNPTSNIIHVKYQAVSTNVKFLVSSISSGQTVEYLATGADNICTIDLSSYPAGNYSISMFVDGEHVDAKVFSRL